MFKTGDKKPSVRLDDDFANLLEVASVPATDIGGVNEEAQRKIGVSRMLDLLPRLFNIGVDDMNLLPVDRRKALVEALQTYFEAIGRIRSGSQGAEAIAAATKGVNDLVRQYRDSISATVKSPELIAAMRPAHLKPRTLEFTGQRLAQLYAMNLSDIDVLQPGDRTSVVEPFGIAIQTDESRADSCNASINNGHIDYSSIYYYDMRAACQNLESALQAVGLLPKPMLQLMRKAGHDRVRDLVLLERSLSAPKVAALLRGKPDADVTALYTAMDAYVMSGRVTGAEAKQFDAETYRLEMSA